MTNNQNDMKWENGDNQNDIKRDKNDREIRQNHKE